MDQLATDLHAVAVSYGFGILIGVVIAGAMPPVALAAWLLGWKK